MKALTLPPELEGVVPEKLLHLALCDPRYFKHRDDDALVLVFLAEGKLLEIPEDSFAYLLGQCHRFVDRDGGGLNPLGKTQFARNAAVMAAADWHRRQHDRQAAISAVASTVASVEPEQGTPLSSVDFGDDGESPHHVPLENLKPHPRNAEIYAENPDADAVLAEQIRQHGLLEPLVITKDYVVISGHRRLRACRDLGLKTALVVVRKVRPDEEFELLLAYNRQREKNNVEKSREFIALREIEAVKAEARQKLGTLLENSPIGSEKGSARDLAARPLGWSGRTAELAAKVVQEIDRHRKDGAPVADIEAVEAAFNKSIRAGYLAAEKHSWFPHSPKGSAKPSSNPEEAAPLPSAMDAAAATLANTPVAHNLFKRTRASLGKGLQSLPESDRSEALRRYAQALLDLADKIDNQPPTE